MTTTDRRLAGRFLTAAGQRPSTSTRRFLLAWLLGTSAVCAVAGVTFLLAGQAAGGHQLLAFASLANLVNLRTALGAHGTIMAEATPTGAGAKRERAVTAA